MANKHLESLKFPGLSDIYTMTPEIASEYSSSATYAVGDYAVHSGKLYQCTTAISTAEAWTAAHWTEAKLADDVSQLKEDLNEVVVAYDTIDPYLYAENAYLRDGVLTTLSGYNTYKFPLNAFDVLMLKWDSSPFGALGSIYIFSVEHSGGTIENIYGQFTYGAVQGNYTDMVVEGAIPDKSDIVAFYITIQDGNENFMHVALNYPYTQLANDVRSVFSLSAKTCIETLWYYRTGTNWGRFNSPYNTKVLKLKTGDRIVFGKTITGVSGKATIIKTDGTVGSITTTEYTATGDCILYIFDNSSVDGTIDFYPANPLKISTDNIFGDINVNRQFANLEGVAFGTSLTYRAISSYGYLTKLADLSGINFDNQGIGSSVIKGNMLTAIKNYTGYSGKRVCILEGFVNDWYQNLPLGTYTDATEDSVCGCVRSALNYMLSQNANMAVFLILDHYGRNNGGVNCSTTAENGSGLTQYEYYEEIAKVAETLGIPVIKEYEVSQISENTPQYLADNIHLNALGAVQSAYAIWSQFKNYYPNQV